MGIFYSSGSSGKVNEVESRNQNCNDTGYGILAENTAGAAQTITIQRSSVHDYSGNGIETGSDQTPPTLTATINSNYANTPSSNVFGAGIVSDCNTASTISGNNTVGGHAGILVSGCPVSGNTVIDASSAGIVSESAATVSGNTIINAGTYGIAVEAGSGPVSSNRILNSGQYGILVNSSNASVRNNTIWGGSIGIEFNCISGNTVSGNVINGAVTGTDAVPGTFTGVNSFNNVPTVRNGC